MAQLDDRSSKDLQPGIEQGEFAPRKQAVAEEILRRREEARSGPRFSWLKRLLAALKAPFRKFWQNGTEAVHGGLEPQKV